MPAQLEEVVLRAHHFHLQQVRPDARHNLLHRRFRRHVAARQFVAFNFRLRQRPDIDLTARRQRPLLHHHKDRRHHVLRQTLM